MKGNKVNKYTCVIESRLNSMTILIDIYNYFGKKKYYFYTHSNYSTLISLFSHGFPSPPTPLLSRKKLAFK